MHGLVNRAFQGFLVDTYGTGVWGSIRRDAGLEFEDFEAMMRYNPALTERVIFAASRRLDKPPAAFMEDVGTWVATNPKQPGIRRLLRFGGTDFREFLFSIDELPGRAKMAIPYLEVPDLTLNHNSAHNRIELNLIWPKVNLSAVVLGTLRAIADDYGALVLMEAQETGPLSSLIEVELLDNCFAEGNSFSLGGGVT
ncbi:MAG: heme NO-binding domain-containing protein [Pseudomonadota bacterium]